MEDDLTAIREAGVEVLVSALTPAEEFELGLDGEREAAEGSGLRFVSLPIQDRGVPSLDGQTAAQFSELASLVTSGTPVAVHCRIGIGRSSVILAILLAKSGLSVEDAFDLLAKARGVPVPDTAEQRAWVEEVVASGRLEG